MKIAEIMKLHTQQWEGQKPKSSKANVANTPADTVTSLVKQVKKDK